MDDVQEIDVKEVMEQITGKIRMAPQQPSRLDATGSLSDGPIATDLLSLQSNYDTYHIHFTSHRKGLGRFVVLAKQILRKLLTPILERQLMYNAANARVASYLYARSEYARFEETRLRHATAEQVEGIRQQQAATLEVLRQMMEGIGQQQAETFQAVRDAIAEQVGGLAQQQTAALQGVRQALFGSLEQRANAIRDSLTSLGEARMIELERANLRLQTHLNMQERRLSLLLEEARRRLPEPFSREQLQALAEEEQHTLDGLYVSFEDPFRGSRGDIKNHLRVYCPILEEAKVDTDDRLILDLGCGRGE
jgi:hypothetical protein